MTELVGEVNTTTGVENSQFNESTAKVDTSIQTKEVSNTVQAPEQAPKKAEKLFTRDEVAKISNAIKKESYEKARQESLEQSRSTQTQEQSGISSQLNADMVRQIFNEETQKAALKLEAERIVKEFTQKYEQGKAKYPDFEESVGKLNLQQNAHLVEWANGLDNTSDVLYEMAKHPSKFSNLQMLAATAPALAVQEMISLSKSIKQNEEAVKQEIPPQPLSQVKPGNLRPDNGSMSVTDFKKIFRA